MQIKIPKLESRYIPVHSNSYVISSEIHWWKKSSPFIYPNVLINLLTSSKEQIEKLKQDSDEELFLLTDSGGFQVVSGTCNLDWEGSLLRQIELGASKIFSFDKPTVKQKKNEGSLTNFIYMTNKEAEVTIRENFETALKQSEYLKAKYPKEFKKLCYILQGKSYEQLEFNMSLFKEKGIHPGNYSEYFPGGIVYGTKGGDNLYIAIAARHAYETFIKRGIYVHFLGMGSFYRMIILIRNKISTFDSSTILQGTRVNEFINPIDLNSSLQIPSADFIYTKQFCTCPVCSHVDYNDLAKNNPSLIGRNFIGHNLWHLLKMNVFLDSIPLNRYTETVNKIYPLSDDLKRCLDFCDECDKNGFKITYNKYKLYLKKEETKQKSLDI